MSRPAYHAPPTARPPPWWLAPALAVPCAGLAWPTLGRLLRSWVTAPDQPHGLLVPAVSAYLLYRRRAGLAGAPLRGSWWGLALLSFSAGLHLVARAAGGDYLAAVALLPGLAGLVLLAGGWPALRWAWPGVVVLVFLIPPPARVAEAVAGRLRDVAARGGAHALQTAGTPVILEGHTLLLEEYQIAIPEAAGGLGLLPAFGALVTAAAFLSRRPAFDRILLALSAVPIIIAANVLRVAVVALGYWAAGTTWGDVINHHLAGWLVGPLAVTFLWLELKLLDLVLGPPRPTEGKGRAVAHLGSLLLPHGAPRGRVGE